MADGFKIFLGMVVVATTLGGASAAYAQGSDPAALAAVRAAVRSELEASKTDKSIWMYTEHDTTPGKDAVYDTIETSQGSLKRLIELNGRKQTGAAEQRETERIDNYVHDSSAQARRRKAGAHDDAQAAEMLKILPEAFVWTKMSETPEYLTVGFRPNPNFDPPDMHAEVMGQMAGEMVIVKDGHRIKSLRGKLTSDILIGFGILGKLYKGGTFDVERRHLPGDRWQIDQTHVHINGHVLLFKTIGQEEDDIKTDWRPSPAHTLDEAARLLHAEP
jgi:hypothetical protein